MLIAHVSDLHIRKDMPSTLQQARKILKTIKKIGVDHLIISGDLTDSGREVDLNLAATILKINGFDSGKSISVVPGNHDIWGDIINVGKNFRENLLKTTHIQRQKQFFDSLKFAFSDCRSFKGVSKGREINFVKDLGNLLIIGIDSNTIVSVTQNPLGCAGWINPEALSSLFECTYSEPKTKIVLMHHYLYSREDIDRKIKISIGKISMSKFFDNSMKLNNLDEVLNIFNNHGVDLVCHGHAHWSELYLKNNFRVLNAGGPGAEENSFFLIQYDKKGLSVREVK